MDKRGRRAQRRPAPLPGHRQLELPLTVGDLARQAMMSPRTYARRFRETTGTTPLQWLCAERVRRAQDLLENTDDTIERIATRWASDPPTSCAPTSPGSTT